MSPRDGSNIYSQPFPDVVEDTTIESTVYNGFTNDVAADLNAARPIVAGGTGATSADQALFNLAAEKATQVVTNYDSHLWVPGSFRSAAGATGAPTVNAFAGTAIIGEALANPPTNQNVVLEARDLGDASVPGLKYIREKTAGVWSAWTLDVGSQAIRYDADQNLTEVQKAQGRENIYAAPFDALAYNGMQINGSMEVSQELGGTGRTTDGYVCDGWRFDKTNLGYSITTWPADTTTPSGFARFLQLNITTPLASVAAGDYAILSQNIEGYRVSRLAWGTASAQPITIGFWTSHHRTGIYSVAVRNGSIGNRTYAFTYTQNAADVAEYKTVTVPGDVSGTWAKDNTSALTIMFTVACGSTYTVSTANTWQAGSYFAAPGQINGVAATSDVFRLTGVVVLPGIEAPTAAQSPLIMRPYSDELLTCKRYWAAVNAAWTGYAIGTAVYSTTVQYPTQMRIQPTITSSQGILANGGFSVRSASSIGLASTIWGGATPTNQNAAGFLDTLYLDARL